MQVLTGYSRSQKSWKGSQPNGQVLLPQTPISQKLATHTLKILASLGPNYLMIVTVAIMTLIMINPSL